MSVSYDVVIPTVGRASLVSTLQALAAGRGETPEHVFIVDDRHSPEPPIAVPAELPFAVTVLTSGGRGPAAARNTGWRAATATWVAFLDDDVEPLGEWRQALTADLESLDDEVAASQGRIEVPAPTGRRPTDWERNVAGLATARWATADMAYRRDVLVRLGGFDERFPRAYREDADLAARTRALGLRLVMGDRRVRHAVRPAPWWVSVRLQAGNADDAFLRRRHGRHWRRVTGVPKGRVAVHAAITAAGLVALAGSVGRNRRLSLVAAVGWLAGTLHFAWARLRPGPRTPREIGAMAVTSVLIPPLACWHHARGWVRARRLLPATPPAAVLFDRDGTLVVDVPYNGDPDRVELIAGAREALDRLRVAGVPTAVVTNQSGVARGLITAEQVRAVNERIEELVGPLGPWLVCVHGEDDCCGCRKPGGAAIRAAAMALGVDAAECVLIGDIGSDVEAARRAGARAVLVPNRKTRLEEIAAAPVVAADLDAAIDLLVGPKS
jgi:histidinol-phosphate phosphatase family protein